MDGQRGNEWKPSKDRTSNNRSEAKQARRRNLDENEDRPLPRSLHKWERLEEAKQFYIYLFEMIIPSA